MSSTRLHPPVFYVAVTGSLARYSPTLQIDSQPILTVSVIVSSGGKRTGQRGIETAPVRWQPVGNDMGGQRREK